MSEQETVDAIREAYDIAYKAPELNLGNYTHDQVCELNDAMCELYVKLDWLLEKKTEAAQ